MRMGDTQGQWGLEAEKGRKKRVDVEKKDVRSRNRHESEGLTLYQSRAPLISA